MHGNLNIKKKKKGMPFAPSVSIRAMRP